MTAVLFIFFRAFFNNDVWTLARVVKEKETKTMIRTKPRQILIFVLVSITLTNWCLFLLRIEARGHSSHHLDAADEVSGGKGDDSSVRTQGEGGGGGWIEESAVTKWRVQDSKGDFFHDTKSDLHDSEINLEPEDDDLVEVGEDQATSRTTTAERDLSEDEQELPPGDGGSNKLVFHLDPFAKESRRHPKTFEPKDAANKKPKIEKGKKDLEKASKERNSPRLARDGVKKNTNASAAVSASSTSSSTSSTTTTTMSPEKRRRLEEEARRRERQREELRRSKEAEYAQTRARVGRVCAREAGITVPTDVPAAPHLGKLKFVGGRYRVALCNIAKVIRLYEYITFACGWHDDDNADDNYGDNNDDDDDSNGDDNSGENNDSNSGDDDDRKSGDNNNSTDTDNNADGDDDKNERRCG